MVGEMTDRVHLATGVLAWDNSERVGDRYGAVFVNDSPTRFPDERREGVEVDVDRSAIKEWEDEYGTLVAEVVEGRESAHIGDIFHGLRQEEIPSTGETHELGTGRLFVERGDWAPRADYEEPIGIDPEDGSETHWLDVDALYHLHDSTVRLLFLPSGSRK